MARKEILEPIVYGLGSWLLVVNDVLLTLTN